VPDLSIVPPPLPRSRDAAGRHHGLDGAAVGGKPPLRPGSVPRSACGRPLIGVGSPAGFSGDDRRERPAQTQEEPAMTDVDLTDCPFDTEPFPAMDFEPNELDLLDHDPWGFWADAAG